MLTLQPQSPFVIWWQNDDPLDLATYYVRVVIKNAITSATIDTIDLTDNGDGSYTHTWITPVDVSGSGYQINMKITVYTDSGYTSLASNKAIENRDYVIMDRIRHLGGGGGGVDVDYKRIRKIVQEELSTIPKPKDPEPVDFAPVYKYLGRLESKINSIEIPEPEKIELDDIREGLAMISSLVKALPAPEKLDLTSVLEKMEMYNPDAMDTKNKAIVDSIQKIFAKDVLSISEMVDKIQKKLESIPLAITGPVKFPEKEKDDKEDRMEKAKRLLV